MDPLIFKTDTNLTDVDTINSFTRSLIKGDDSVDTYSPDSSFLFWFCSLSLASFSFVQR